MQQFKIFLRGAKLKFYVTDKSQFFKLSVILAGKSSFPEMQAEK